MGAQDVKRRLWSPLLDSHLSLIVLLLFLGADSLVHGQNLTIISLKEDGDALHTIWEAWKRSLDPSDNLAGWNSTSNTFCDYRVPGSIHPTSNSWQGVQCTLICNDTTIDPNCTVKVAYVIGLSLSNASIVGTLPPAVGNISNLYTLEITGNPNLTGPLPGELQNTWINALDVHDNAFNGTIPYLTSLWNLQQLDLSGNKFTGPYPFKQIQTMSYLQQLSIGGNLLSGEIQADAFTTKIELETLDISDNSFNGTLPDLSPMHKLTHLDVSNNTFEGPLPDLRGPFPSLLTVSLARNNFTGTVANLLDILDVSVSASLATVDLSHNQLTGTLPSWNASSLGSIQELNLDDNSLSGTLNISQMFAEGLLMDKYSANTSKAKLNLMSLKNNQIEHVISDPYSIANISTSFLLQGNPYCENYDTNDDAHRCYCSQICFVTATNTDSHKIVIIATTTSVAAVVLVSLVVVGAVLLKNRRYKRYLRIEFERRFEELDMKPTIFSFSELRGATRDFHKDMKLGKGTYGAVYKGVLPSGNVVAVKQLFNTARGQDEFLNEVVLITGMKHRNLVNLKGCCLRESQRLLVYEYVDNFDVDQILLGSRKEEMKAQLATWPVRLKICLGIAHGLHYLHAMAHPRVIHRDIKAANILLNTNLEAKIADFGLALLFPDEQTHIMTATVAGTKGYLAPEYASLGQLSDKVDVYSFGVLCLEIISGRHNIDKNAPLEQVYLSEWARQLHEENRLMGLVDPTLHLRDEELWDVQRVIKMCLQCISNAVQRRPSMACIVSILQGSTDSEAHGLGSVSEEGSNNSFPNSSHGIPHHGCRDGDEISTVELSEIRGR